MASIGHRPRQELRKHRRQPMHRVGWIYLGKGALPSPCSISDISDAGVRLKLPNDLDIPTEFILLLTVDGRTRRRCRVVWRDQGLVGAEFIGRLAQISAAD